MSASTGRPAVFVDRDGTINAEVEGALSDPSQLELIPGAAPAIARLNAAGFAVVCVTNQSAIARGWMTERDFERVTAALGALLAADGAHLDRVLHCPHHPTEGLGDLRQSCACRKPGGELFERAIAELELAAERSWVVGDAGRDLEAGGRVGARPILVATGKGRREHARLRAEGGAPETFVADLAAAVDHILAPG